MTAVTHVWGLPLAAMTRADAAEAVMALVDAGRPSYFITANLHYAMITAQRPEMGPINERAAFLLADGAPLVWASRRRAVPLPERVAGSDLIFDLCELSASRGRSMFFLGGAEGVAEEAARRLRGRYPGLRIVGTLAPAAGSLVGDGCREVIRAIRSAKPDILLVAFGQPKGELWISEHLGELGVPVSVQVGATLDFVAGRVNRAPKSLQKIGLEWAYRIYTDPKRLGPRYAQNAVFLFRRVVAEMFRRRAPRGASPARGAVASPPEARA